MRVRVYFCKETDPQYIFRGDTISRQALNTIYELVWESEFKNILNAGRVWLKFKDEQPFGIPLKEKRCHKRISLGDLIQLSNTMYMVDKIGIREIKTVD
ncbi:MAG: hypothetical protein ACTHKF_03310 [Candidatus Nitrosocosmicus sp.]